MTPSIRLRLVLATVALFGLLVTGLGVTTYRILARQLDRDTTDRITELLNGIEGYLRFDADEVTLEFNPQDDDESAFVQDATRYYQVYDAATGRLLVESPGLTPLGLDLTLPEIQASRTVGRQVDFSTPYGRVRFISHEVRRAERTYILMVGGALNQMDAALARYRAILLWWVPGAFLVAIAAAWWLASFALRPIRAMATMASRIDVTTLDRRLPIRGGHDELDDVAGAFNLTLARLQRSVEDMRQFSAALAHELRTPLAALRGEIELSLMAPGTTESQQRALASQLDEIDHLTRLIDHILTLARAESGQIRLSFAPVDLAALALTVVEQLEPIAESRGLSLTCSRTDGLIVDGDAGWLQRLLLNLLDNALKFTPPNGRVHVRLARDDDSACIEVQDTGVGLTPQDARQVFERFFRADPARTTSAEGAGLGLSLVQWIAAQHHGTVDVTSRLGEGSTFTVRIPLGPASRGLDPPLSSSTAA